MQVGKLRHVFFATQNIIPCQPSQKSDKIWISSEAIAQIRIMQVEKERHVFFLHKIYFRASLHRSLITPQATLEPAFPVLRLPSSSLRPRSSYKRKRKITIVIISFATGADVVCK